MVANSYIQTRKRPPWLSNAILADAQARACPTLRVRGAVQRFREVGTCRGGAVDSTTPQAELPVGMRVYSVLQHYHSALLPRNEP